MENIERQWRERAERQYGVIARSQLLDDGLSPRQLDRRVANGVLARAHPGVFRMVGSPGTFEQRVMAASLASCGVASHRCGAALWGLFRCEPGLVEVTVADRRAPRLEGVAAHTTDRLRAIDVTEVMAIPVTTPARTLLDLGAVASPAVVESAVEDALRRGLVSLDWLERSAARIGGPGRDGSGVLRQVLAARPRDAAPTESVLEDEIVRLLLGAGLPAPVRQHPIAVHGGPPLRLDVSYPWAQLAIEGQSVTWHTGRESLQRDCDKRNLLLSIGWRLLVVTWTDVRRRPRSVVAAVAEALSGQPATVTVDS